MQRSPTRTFARAARLFRALGDPARLRTLQLLLTGEASVASLAARSGEDVHVMAHRLRVLHAENLVDRRREGGRLFYALPHCHVVEMMNHGLGRRG